MIVHLVCMSRAALPAFSALPRPTPLARRVRLPRMSGSHGVRFPGVAPGGARVVGLRQHGETQSERCRPCRCGARARLFVMHAQPQSGSGVSRVPSVLRRRGCVCAGIMPATPIEQTPGRLNRVLGAGIVASCRELHAPSRRGWTCMRTPHIVKSAPRYTRTHTHIEVSP